MIDFLLMVGGAFFAMFVSGIVNYGKREWVGLTDEDRYEFAAAQYGWEDLLIAAEAKLKEKNT
jgi:hypothetical protein